MVKTYTTIVLTSLQGFLEANESVELEVRMISGCPEPFLKFVRIQVAHFEPHSIEVSGEGVFPRLVLDLPRQYREEEQNCYEKARRHLKEKRCKNYGDQKQLMSFLAIGEEADEAHVSVSDFSKEQCIYFHPLVSRHTNQLT